MTGFLQGGSKGLKVPFCREEELTDIVSAIRTEDCRAVFLTSDSGMGASTILQKLAESAGEHVPVLTVRGSVSLARIPFGALAPSLELHNTPPEAIRLEVLRQVLAAIDTRRTALGSLEAGSGDLPLVVIDDAHAIDEGTAELVVSLVMAGIINVVASYSRRHNMPDPLPRLWARGEAEYIVLQPLSREQGHEYCEAVLGGRVVPATSWHYWSTAAGNPMFLHLLISEAVEQGHLTRKAGTWMGEPGHQAHNRGLEEAVTGVLRGLTREAQAALNVIALAEPLARSELNGLVSDRTIQELLGWSLIMHQPAAPEFLVLAKPIYGQVIRDMIPVAQSRVLHGQVIGDLTDGGGSTESLLRRVLWAVEVGIAVGDATLLRAAILASKLFQSATSLLLANEIKGKDFQLRAAMVKARAKYNLGDYQGAFSLMEFTQSPDNVQDLIFGALLRASTRLALAMPVEMLMDDAQELRRAGESLATADPGEAGRILAYSQSSALMVELIGFSRAGRYAEMTELTALLLAQHGLPTAADRLNRTMALTMESERLTAQGFPEQGARRAAEAFSLEHSEENDVFFLPESIILRHLAAMLCAGHWSAAAGAVEQFSLEDGPIVFTFGGSASVVRGMAMVRAGALEEALKALRVGREALQRSDPQQLLGFSTAMAAYCSARLGHRELALTLLSEHVDGSGMYVVLAHEHAYLSAARQILTPDGAGLAELLAQADAAQASGAAMLELNALVLAMELGDEGVAGRVASVAGKVEGPWARGLHLYAAALAEGDGHALKEAGAVLAEAGVLGFAKLALAKSAALLKGNGLKDQARTAREGLWKLSAGSAVPVGDGIASLTKRERQITALAAQGLTDRDIAAELTLSQRTVEGHLYRAYAKLGIATREELGQVL